MSGVGGQFAGANDPQERNAGRELDAWMHDWCGRLGQGKLPKVPT